MTEEIVKKEETITKTISPFRVGLKKGIAARQAQFEEKIKSIDPLSSYNGEYKMSRLIRALLQKYIEGKVFVNLE